MTMEPPKAAAKAVKTNRLGLDLKVYKGADSTLCNGCGHDAITHSIIKSFYEYGVPPHRVAKLSGMLSVVSSDTNNFRRLCRGQQHHFRQRNTRDFLRFRFRISLVRRKLKRSRDLVTTSDGFNPTKLRGSPIFEAAIFHERS